MSRILHASIPADDPATVAHVLARILGGSAMPFPPGGPDAWIAWADDGFTEIEVVKRGAGLVRAEQCAEWRGGATHERASEVHLAIATPLPAAQAVALAQRHGWPSGICSRGGLFDLTEVWIDGCFLIELFDPDQAQHFAETISARSWAQMLASKPALENA